MGRGMPVVQLPRTKNAGGIFRAYDFLCFLMRLEFTHFLSSEMHHALENEGRSTFRQVVFSGCLEENSEGLQRGLRSRSA